MDPLYPDTASITSALGELVPDDLDLAGLPPELIASLAANRVELGNTELPPPPADLVERWEAALAELPPLVPSAPTGASHAAPVAEQAGPTAPERRPGGRRAVVTQIRRRAGRWAGGLAAAAAVAALVVVALPGPADPLPADPLPADTGPLALTTKDLPVGGQDYGPLRDPARRAACLAHAGAPGATVLGARQVDWAGRPGVLLVLPTGEPGRLRALVVSPDCAADRGEVLADIPVGR
jgi:hypothetical protein